MITDNPNQMTKYDACTSLLVSQWGPSDYRSWCELEAARWNATGRPAHVEFNGRDCALFKGEQPLVTGFPLAQL